MSEFLDTLKLRLADAQQRLQVAQQNLQRVQQEHATVMAEYSSWQNAVTVETRKEQQLTQIPPVPFKTEAKGSSALTVAVASPATPLQPTGRAEESELNKTTLIRDVLRQHPNGIRPVEVWKEVKDQVARPYVYSVLKRMKDKKQVSVRRGKYFLVVIVKSEEAKDHSLTVQ